MNVFPTIIKYLILYGAVYLPRFSGLILLNNVSIIAP